jgi:hypothetical protein
MKVYTPASFTKFTKTMKLSKSLLQAILVGVTLGTAGASCTLIEELDDKDRKGQPTQDALAPGNDPTQLQPWRNTGGNPPDNCPACGMG